MTDNSTPNPPDWNRAVERWLGVYRPSTAAAYRYGVDRWTRWCEDQGLDPWYVRRGDVETHLAQLGRSGLAEAS